MFRNIAFRKDGGEDEFPDAFKRNGKSSATSKKDVQDRKEIEKGLDHYFAMSVVRSPVGRSDGGWDLLQSCLWLLYIPDKVMRYTDEHESTLLKRHGKIS